jgi:hypothetical protein
MSDPVDLMTEHAELLGRLVVAWNEVHWLVYVLFAKFSGMEPEQAKDVFFELKSDRSQRGIALAASKTALAKYPTLWGRSEEPSTRSTCSPASETPRSIPCGASSGSGGAVPATRRR